MIGGLNARYLPLEILLFEFPVFSCLPWFHPSIHEADRREGCFSSIKREFSTLKDKTPDRSPVSLVGNQRVERSLISPGNKSNKALFPTKFYLSLPASSIRGALRLAFVGWGLVTCPVHSVLARYGESTTE